MAHLTLSQRGELAALHRLGKTQQEIAFHLGCSQSTVSRELRRNNPHPRLWYGADRAHEHAVERRSLAKEQCLKWYDHADLLSYVLRKLEETLSPDQIEKRVRKDFPRRRDMRVSASSIYSYVRNDRWNGGMLHKHLRYRGKKRKWYGLADGRRKNNIPNRRDITERPKIVEMKKRYGDWESDLVVGGSAVATFVERKSKLLRAVLLKDQTKDEFLRATREAFRGIPERWRKTMTHDNGREIACHEQITENLQIDVYCATPYRSCERGLNEHTNGLLRQFFPKKTDFRTVTEAELARAVELINNRPRRSLQYRSPNEVFQKYISQHYAFHVLE